MTKLVYEFAKMKEWDDVQTYQVFAKGRKMVPGVPSCGELKIFKRFLQNQISGVEKPKVLILGATSELRNVALKMGCGVVSCDLSMSVILHNENYVKSSDKSKDIVIRGNWFTVPLRENYFNAVLGDAAINNVPLARHNELFSRIRQWLKPGGIILVREMIYPDSREPEDFIKILEFYRRHKMNLREFYLRTRFWLLKNKVYNARTKMIRGRQVFKEIKNLYRKGVLNKKEFADLYQFKNPVSHTILRQSEWKSIFCRYFSIESFYSTASKKYGYWPFKIICGKSNITKNRTYQHT